MCGEHQSLPHTIIKFGVCESCLSEEQDHPGLVQRSVDPSNIRGLCQFPEALALSERFLVSRADYVVQALNVYYREIVKAIDNLMQIDFVCPSMYQINETSLKAGFYQFLVKYGSSPWVWFQRWR